MTISYALICAHTYRYFVSMPRGLVEPLVLLPVHRPALRLQAMPLYNKLPCRMNYYHQYFFCTSINELLHKASVKVTQKMIVDTYSDHRSSEFNYICLITASLERNNAVLSCTHAHLTCYIFLLLLCSRTYLMRVRDVEAIG